METPETIPQALAVEAPSANAAAGAPPWGQDRPAPTVFAVPVVRLERRVETIHWSVIALTAFTAIAVLFGAYGRNSSHPRELLPIVVDAR